MLESLHINAHAASAARDGAHCRVKIGCSQIGQLDLGNVFELLAVDLAHFVRVGRAATFWNADRFTDQH